MTNISRRGRAWRNLMVATVNEGLDRNMFGLDPKSEPSPLAFRFEVGGLPAIAHVSDAGFCELAIKAAIWPTPDAEQWIKCSNAGFLAGECFAYGWFERLKGRWLQTPQTSYVSNVLLRCRANKMASVADLVVKPMGYADCGKFML
jgi:hypothetical protein